MFKKLALTVLVVALFATFTAVGVVAADDQLINYHWWTAGGEKEAIDAVFALYGTVYPEVEIVENPTAGGGGGIMRAQIKT
ncbi:MAG: hypothetical protein KAU10_01785, partial [Dehalococcoidia bacterium]|nr:hypothetical protein [Dehalococcoidia bacterium]